jgi:hypothetical protein
MATIDLSAASPAETRTRSAGVDAFLIARGGPFYHLQQRLGLLHEKALHAGRRAAILVAVAWGVPLVLSAVAGHALGPAASRPFLLDLGAWARFLIAIGIFVLMERLVEERLRVHLRQFVRAPPRPRCHAGRGRGGGPGAAPTRFVGRRGGLRGPGLCDHPGRRRDCAGRRFLDLAGERRTRRSGTHARRLVVRPGQQPPVLVPAAALAGGGMPYGAYSCATSRA